MYVHTYMRFVTFQMSQRERNCLSVFLVVKIWFSFYIVENLIYRANFPLWSGAHERGRTVLSTGPRLWTHLAFATRPSGTKSKFNAKFAASGEGFEKTPPFNSSIQIYGIRRFGAVKITYPVLLLLYYVKIGVICGSGSLWIPRIKVKEVNVMVILYWNYFIFEVSNWSLEFWICVYLHV